MNKITFHFSPIFNRGSEIIPLAVAVRTKTCMMALAANIGTRFGHLTVITTEITFVTEEPGWFFGITVQVYVAGRAV